MVRMEKVVSRSVYPELITLKTLYDSTGNLSIIDPNNDSNLPFSIKRVYFLWDLDKNASRGSHAHKELQQLIIAINGAIKVKLKKKNENLEFVLNNPNTGLYVPQGWWRELEESTIDSRILVIASQEYLESDYIRDFATFTSWVDKND